MEEVSFDRNSVTSREWGAYPIIKFPDIPKIDVLMLPRQDQPPLGVGKSASVPSAAAIANAIFDATGVRFRELPFTPERILAGLRGGQPATQTSLAGSGAQSRPGGRIKIRLPNRSAHLRAWLRWLPQWSALPRWRCRGGRSRRSRGRIRRPIRRRRSRGASSLRRSATARSATRKRMARSTPAAAPIETPFGIIYCDQHHARSRDRHRRVVVSRLRARDARGHSSRRQASLSGVSL